MLAHVGYIFCTTHLKLGYQKPSGILDTASVVLIHFLIMFLRGVKILYRFRNLHVSSLYHFVHIGG